MDVEKITSYLCDSDSVSGDDIQKIKDKKNSDNEFSLNYDELEAAMIIADAAICDKYAESQKSVWSKLENSISKKSEGYYITKKRIYGYAAVAVVVFAVFGFGMLLMLGGFVDEQMISIKVANTGSTTTRMFDGSVVTINSNSALEYSSEYNIKNRDVVLSGEAWFDVAKGEKPFVVYSGNISVTALGTSFNIKSHDDFTVVTLSSGKVIVANALTNDSLTSLIPGQKAIIDANMNVNIEQCDALAEGIWRENTLEFNGESLDEIVETLEKWHGITIINNVKPNGKTYWMKMTEKRITTTLEVFRNLEDIDYQIVGDTVVLNSRKI